MASAQQIIELAQHEVGTFESPRGSNRQKYGEAFGWNGVPWCAQFLSWVFTKAGMSLTVGKGTASVPEALAWYRKQGRFSTTPQVGALVFYGPANLPFHIGLVYAVDARYIWTIEGNTSSTGGSRINGGEVALKKRLRTSTGPMHIVPDHRGEVMSERLLPTCGECRFPVSGTSRGPIARGGADTDQGR